VRKTLLAALLLGGLILPAYAQPQLSGLMLQTSARETVRHADTTEKLELYITDGEVPSAKTPCKYVSRSNTYEHGVLNHVPGYPNKKVWLLVKVVALNIGELKSDKTEMGDIQLAYSPDLGGYLLDMSLVPAGTRFIAYTVTHDGGEVTHQILLWLLRSKREVTDQAGLWINIYDPEVPYDQGDIKASPWLEGFVPTNGAAAYQAATNTTAPINRIAEVPEPTALVIEPVPEVVVAQATVQLNVRGRKSCGGTFQLVSEDQEYYSEIKTGNVVQFSVPANKKYVVLTSQAEGNCWEVKNCPAAFVVSVTQKTDIVIEAKGGRRK
jgi:hypothetical protein